MFAIHKKIIALKSNLDNQIEQLSNPLVISELNEKIYKSTKALLTTQIEHEVVKNIVTTIYNNRDNYLSKLRQSLVTNYNERTFSDERILHKQLWEFLDKTYSKDIVFKEVTVIKPSQEKGRIDLLIQTGEDKYADIIELKGSKVKYLIKQKRISKSLRYAINQVQTYGNSRMYLEKMQNIHLSELTKKVILGRRMDTDNGYYLIHEIQISEGVIVQSWDDYIDSLERIFT